MLKSFPHSLAASHLVRDTDIRACKSASIQRGLSALPAAFRPNSSHAGHNSTPDDIRNDVGALCDLDRLEETAETWLHVIASDSSVSAIQKRATSDDSIHVGVSLLRPSRPRVDDDDDDVIKRDGGERKFARNYDKRTASKLRQDVHQEEQ